MMNGDHFFGQTISFLHIQDITGQNNNTKLNFQIELPAAQHSCVNQNCIMGKAFRLKPASVLDQKLHKQGILGKRILSLVMSAGESMLKREEFMCRII